MGKSKLKKTTTQEKNPLPKRNNSTRKRSQVECFERFWNLLGMGDLTVGYPPRDDCYRLQSARSV